MALVHCDAALMFDFKPLGYDGVYITTASCNATVCVPYTKIGARSELPQEKKNIEKKLGGLTFWAPARL